MRNSRRSFLKRSAAWGVLGGALWHEDTLARLRSLAAAADAGGRSPGELAGDEDFWVQVQQAFTVDRSIINLNNGGVSPSPAVVQQAMRRHLEHSNQCPPLTMWQQLDPQVETVRARLARVFGCDAEEMAITRNSSEALEICIYGMDLEPGDEVVACEVDYPRMINTYRQREQRDGIKLVLLELPCPIQDPQQVVEAYRQAITPRTRVLLVSHVVFVSGQIMPVREIGRLGAEHGIPVIVDGAHAFAHLAFSREQLGCDYYGTSLHKWLTAPHGTGFLYVRRERIADLWPLMAAVEPRSDDIRKFEEIGTHPVANRLAIAEAIVLHEALGPQRKLARLRRLRDLWAGRLGQDRRVRFAARLDEANCGGIATMQIEGVDPLALQEHLWQRHRVVAVAIDYAGVRGLRVTPNVYTTPAEIDLFCRAVEDVLANGLPA